MNTIRHEVNTPRVAAELLDGEVMVIDFDQGLYYSLTGSAAAIWALVTAQHTVPEAHARLEMLYGSDVTEAIVQAFTTELEDHGLIRLKAANSSLEIDLSGFTSPFTVPKLETYSDMQEMLLIDPIHDVEPSIGWPKLPPQ